MPAVKKFNSATETVAITASTKAVDGTAIAVIVIAAMVIAVTMTAGGMRWQRLVQVQ
jgi:hypothetical protein